MRRHRLLCLLSFIVVTLLLLLSLLRLDFKEDISDFLPLDSRHQHALKVYQDISGANRLFALFQYRDTTQADPDVMVSAIEAFTSKLEERDTTGMVRDLVAQVDITKAQEVSAFVYGHIPYFLTVADYERMDSLVAQTDFVGRQLEQDKQLLMFPVGGLLVENLQRDPLNLFTPVVTQLQRASGEMRYEQYDGYIFSPDMQRAVVMMSTPYGASETENNSRLIAMLDEVKTTVGAFLTLVPLKSAALRDLGLFSSFLLVGTILFVLLYLPHLARKPQKNGSLFLARLGNVRLEEKHWLVAAILVLTVFFGYFSFRTSFDSNMSHINYMTDEQKTDMAYFQQLMAGGMAQQKVNVVSTGSTADSALDQSLRIQPQLAALRDSGLVDDLAGCTRFLCSQAEQQERLQRWQEWVNRHGEKLLTGLQTEGRKAGFTEGSFDEFNQILNADYQPQDIAYFNVLTSALFSQNVSLDSLAHDYSVVDVLTLREGLMPEDLDQRLANLGDASYAFDIGRMNSAVANSLSDDFNYIGWACGFIVFFFLWFSFRSLKLAMLSFLPMAISWVWILGLMGLLDMQFNIVNVILATFIFGQGDDYTIFMTEGAVYEQKYQRPILASYKHSIILSALIMFIGIGTLIVARHPIPPCARWPR